MADRIISDSDSVSCSEGIETVHGHRGHRGRYPHTPGPPPPPESKPRTTFAMSMDEPRQTIRRQVL